MNYTYQNIESDSKKLDFLNRICTCSVFLVDNVRQLFAVFSDGALVNSLALRCIDYTISLYEPMKKNMTDLCSRGLPTPELFRYLMDTQRVLLDIKGSH